ncbi:transcriptional regulator, TetR family [Piscinibacter sakaiensis]|uniref:Transcriptional regulator, TetR family n=1 Tax=Piscinibacter sakaiensis TaxID=1547922 RepID=A0A0K8NZT5_PISS1|nr:transcriptional regulator, TetR family [Piscinibacter sakaiensis]
MEVFWSAGFNGCSVQDLTDAAHVPKGSFYNHFDGKEALALEALATYAAQNDPRALLDTSVEPVERLRRDFRKRWKIVKERGYKGGCFLGSLSSEIADSHEGARAEFVRYYQRWSEAIAAVIAEAQANGTVAATADPQALGRFVLNAWQGTLLRAKTHRGEEPFKDFQAVVFGGLLAPGA